MEKTMTQKKRRKLRKKAKQNLDLLAQQLGIEIGKEVARFIMEKDTGKYLKFPQLLPKNHDLIPRVLYTLNSIAHKGTISFLNFHLSISLTVVRHVNTNTPPPKQTSKAKSKRKKKKNGDENKKQQSDQQQNIPVKVKTERKRDESPLPPANREENFVDEEEKEKHAKLRKAEMEAMEEGRKGMEQESVEKKEVETVSLKRIGG
jgi:hypothetical protein